MPFTVSVVDSNGKSVEVNNAAYTAELPSIIMDLTGSLKLGVLRSIVIKDWKE